MARVRICVSFEQLGRFLRLPEGASVVDVPFSLADYFALYPSETLTLTVDMPDAPEGAASATMVMASRTDLPDPVTCEGTWWYREDGSLIVPASTG
jgi:hypothetical protein